MLTRGDVRTPPRPPFEIAQHPGTRRPCPMCGEVVKSSRGWWHPECVEMWHYVAFPANAIRLLMDLHGRRCWECGAEFFDMHYLLVGRWLSARPELEHIRPLWSLTIEESRDLKWWLPFNLQLLCRACHRVKTAREAGERARLLGSPAVRSMRPAGARIA